MENLSSTTPAEPVTPFTHPDRYTRGTDAAMYTTLGLPVPVTAQVAKVEPLTFAQMVERGIIRVTDKAAQVSRQPRAFVASEPSRASCRPGAVTTRSHRHHSEVK